VNKTILTIVPSRNRNSKCLNFYESFKDNTLTSRFCFALDDDDAHNYDFIDDEKVFYEINPRMGMNKTLNYVANKYVNEYDYICFMGDDFRCRTYAWDNILLAYISDIKYGIVYGNDLLQMEYLPTSVMMDSEIIKKLGYMSPLKMNHMYIDNYWKKLGETLGTLRYVPEVILEHMHFSNNKSELDDIYREVNSQEITEKDIYEYNRYLNEDFYNEIKKLTD
jgi:hypothetical protein